jgi:polyisoprenoid-binding protein YceI
MTVKGRFDRYDGTLQLNGRPAVALAIDADSLDTKHGKRDKHLRSADFFDVAHQPQVRFESDDAALAGDTLKVRGELHAAAAASRSTSTPPCARSTASSRSRPAPWPTIAISA